MDIRSVIDDLSILAFCDAIRIEDDGKCSLSHKLIKWIGFSSILTSFNTLIHEK